MNTRKLRKAILTLCAALVLVSLSVGATLAYLTSTDAVVNTFTVGNVNITLDETKVDEYGKAVEGAERVQTNEYKLLPGHEYTKDPIVHVAKGSEESYIRMFVQITDIADLKAACDVAVNDPFLPEQFVTGWDPAVWVSTKEITSEGDTCTYEFRYHTHVDARKMDVDLPALFQTIKVPGAATNEEIAALSDMKISVTAQAIQADGFKDADAAWAAWIGGLDFTVDESTGENPGTVVPEELQPEDGQQ